MDTDADTDKINRALNVFEALREKMGPVSSIDIPAGRPTSSSARGSGRHREGEGGGGTEELLRSQLKSSESMVKQLYTKNQALEARVKELENLLSKRESEEETQRLRAAHRREIAQLRSQHAAELQEQQERHLRALREAKETLALQRKEADARKPEDIEAIQRLTQERDALALRLAQTADPKRPTTTKKGSSYLAVLQDTITSLEFRLKESNAQLTKLTRQRIAEVVEGHRSKDSLQRLFDDLCQFKYTDDVRHEVERTRMNEILYLLEREVASLSL